MQSTIFVIRAIVKVKLQCPARYNDVPKKGNVPLYDLRKYEIKIRTVFQKETALLTWTLSVTLHLCTKALLHVWSYNL